MVHSSSIIITLIPVCLAKQSSVLLNIFLLQLGLALLYVVIASAGENVNTYGLDTVINSLYLLTNHRAQLDLPFLLFSQSLPLVLFHAPFVLPSAQHRILSRRFLHTKTCLCGRNMTLCHRLRWISTGAWRWRQRGDARRSLMLN